MVKLNRGGRVNASASEKVKLSGNELSGQCLFKAGKYLLNRVRSVNGCYGLKIGGLSSILPEYGISIVPVKSPVSATRKVIMHVDSSQRNWRNSPTIQRSAPAVNWQVDIQAIRS